MEQEEVMMDATDQAYFEQDMELFFDMLLDKVKSGDISTDEAKGFFRNHNTQTEEQD